MNRQKSFVVYNKKKLFIFNFTSPFTTAFSFRPETFIKTFSLILNSFGVKTAVTETIKEFLVNDIPGEVVDDSIERLLRLNLIKMDVAGSITKDMIRNFRAKVCSFAESDTTDQVYQMNIQFFPLTKKVDRFKIESGKYTGQISI